MSLFKNPDARRRMLDWHETMREALSFPTDSISFPTRFGETHALAAGPPDAPALVCLHGALASSSHLLLEVGPLTERFRVIAIDIIGQSPKSADRRLPIHDGSYGEFLLDCLDRLSLPSASVLGVSWGGFVALRAAAIAPERISHLSLMVPAALVAGSARDGFQKIGWPMLRYQMFPTERNRSCLLDAIFTNRDPLWEGSMGDAFRNYRLDLRPPRLVRDGELANFHAPVQVFAARHDLSFPGDALLSRAKVVLPNVVDTILLPDSRHAPSFSPDDRGKVARRIEAFLTSESFDAWSGRPLD